MARFAFILAVIGLATAKVASPEIGPKLSTQRIVRAKLQRAVSFPAVKWGTTLEKALALLTDRFDVTIVLDKACYQKELQILEPENQPVGLPAMRNVQLQGILRLLVNQVEGDFFVAPDGIVEVVPATAVMNRLLSRRIAVRFDHVPLEKALRDLATETECSITLDERRAGDRGRIPVSADFRDITLGTAVVLLADRAGLSVVQLERVLFVTTEGTARAIRRDPEHKRREEGME